jgi:hypothetical protein
MQIILAEMHTKVNQGKMGYATGMVWFRLTLPQLTFYLILAFPRNSNVWEDPPLRFSIQAFKHRKRVKRPQKTCGEIGLDFHLAGGAFA